MSDPMSNAEIEDVLKSIRRLVSDDLRPAAHAAEPVVQQPPVAEETGDARLLLTPSLRVVPPVAAPSAPPAPADDVWEEEADWVREPLAPLGWVEPAEPEMPVEAEMPAEADLAADLPTKPLQLHPAGAQDSAEALLGADSFDLSDLAAIVAPKPVPAAAAAPGRSAGHRFTLTAVEPASEDVIFAARGDMLQDDDLHDPMAEAPLLVDVAPMPWDQPLEPAEDSALVADAAAPDQILPAPAEPDLPPQAEAPDAAQVAAPVVAVDDALTLAEEAEAWADQAAAEVIAGLNAEALLAAAAEAPAPEPASPEPSAEAEPAAVAPAFAQANAAEPAATEPAAAEPVAATSDSLDQPDADQPITDFPELDLTEPEVTYDEELLRDLVRDIIREELAGGLGEKITRNVRKLVRAEIAQALAARDLN